MGVQVVVQRFAFSLVQHERRQQSHTVGAALTGGFHAGDRGIAGSGHILLSHHRGLEQAAVVAH